jgi:hypothetical protein
VAEVSRPPSQVFQHTRVRLAVDFRKLEEVFVILERRQLPAEEAFATSDESLWAEPAPDSAATSEPTGNPELPEPRP